MPATVHRVLGGSGERLPADTQAFMEDRLGHDFSSVRVHTGELAADSASAVNADAYTVGNHIVFGAGRYDPHTSSGRVLLAHELTHVTQDPGSASSGILTIEPPGSREEKAAERAGLSVNERAAAPKATEAPAGSPRAGRLRRSAATGALVGGVGGALAGAAIGLGVGGPIGALVGGVLGGLVGAAVGAGIGSIGEVEDRVTTSCPVRCDGADVGTLQAEGLFYHQSRNRIVREGSSRATGVGTALHFTESSAAASCPCDDYKIIQVLETTHPSGGRGNSYVDNAGNSSPFYGDTYRSGSGRHEIPEGYPGAGDEVTSTRSIYDRPYRNPARLGGRSLRWEAEALVTCVRNAAPDKILGGATYGFARTYDSGSSSHGPVRGIGPACQAAPSTHFLSTLRSDPAVSSYSFEGK